MKIAFDPQVALSGIQSSSERARGADKQENLKMLCQDFESIFINSLFREMRKSIPDEGFFGPDMGADIYEELMDAEIAREMARRGGLGLGQRLYEQIQGKSCEDEKLDDKK